MIDPRIEKAFLSGHASNPDFPNACNLRYGDLEKLTVSDKAVVEMFQSWSRFDANYLGLVAEIHGRDEPTYDGDIATGGAMAALAAMARCGHPDYPLLNHQLQSIYASGPHISSVVIEGMRTTATESWFDGEELLGNGNWPRCHNVGDYHAAVVLVDMDGIASFLRPVFPEVLKGVQAAYRELGWLPIFVDRATRHDLITGKQWELTSHEIDFSFVQRSSGWIGLAQVMSGVRCGQRMWCRYLASYRPSNIVREWITLIKHELGHNCGTGHTRGGVMNPSIVRGLPIMWPTSDPLHRWLRQRFGGLKVPLQPWEEDRPDEYQLVARVDGGFDVKRGDQRIFAFDCSKMPGADNDHWARSNRDNGLDILKGRDDVVATFDIVKN